MKVWFFFIWAWTRNQICGLPFKPDMNISQSVENENIQDMSEYSERFGRFILQGGIGSSNNLDLLSSVSGMNPLNLKINRNTILKGIFEPDNIFIHVGQNIVDVVGSSIFWTLLAMFTSQTSFADRTSTTTSSSGTSKATVKLDKDVSKLFKDFAIPSMDFQSSYKIQSTSASNHLPSSIQPPDVDLTGLRQKYLHQQQQQKLLTRPFFVPSSPIANPDVFIDQRLTSPDEIDRVMEIKPSSKNLMKENDPDTKSVLEDKQQQIEGAAAPMTQGKKMKLKKVTNKKSQSVKQTSSSTTVRNTS